MEHVEADIHKCVSGTHNEEVFLVVIFFLSNGAQSLLYYLHHFILKIRDAFNNCGFVGEARHLGLADLSDLL